MIPVPSRMAGSGARKPDGRVHRLVRPRGLASIVFAVIVEDAHWPHTATILTATYLTVGLSVMVHGASAAPLVRRYASWFSSQSGEPGGVRRSSPCRPTSTAFEVPRRRCGHRHRDESDYSSVTL